MSNPRLLGKHHQRSSSTGSHGLLFGIGAAAGPHNIYHQPLTHQASSQSTDPLDSEDEDENSAIGTPPDVKGTLSKWTNYIHGWQGKKNQEIVKICLLTFYSF